MQSVCGVEFSALSVRWSVVGGLFVSVLCVNEYIVGLMGAVAVDRVEERCVSDCMPVSSGVIGLKFSISCTMSKSSKWFKSMFGRSTSGEVCCELCCSVTSCSSFVNLSVLSFCTASISVSVFVIFLSCDRISAAYNILSNMHLF